MAGTHSQQNDSTIPTQPALYTPLEHLQHILRLIKILPSNTDEEQVSCLMETFELSEDIQYAALSYVWGDPNITEDVLVNGFTLSVTTNLASALRNFRQYGFPENEESEKLEYLWVDAICINQSDDAIPERNRRVAFMGQIYSTASSVLCWLGPPDSRRTGTALQIIRDYASVVDGF
ncbi:heterokaryon incompatibility protein-domain-containing protein [Xylaria scruposa]|nr:heterokaryon incompatibility protein-domain-containing protein [Xylaria scruposa]